MDKSGEYNRVGKFQWVDPHAIEDKEELYLTPLFVLIAFLGISSMIYELQELVLNSIQTKRWYFFNQLFRWLSLAYGVILIFFSLLFIFLTIKISILK